MLHAVVTIVRQFEKAKMTPKDAKTIWTWTLIYAQVWVLSNWITKATAAPQLKSTFCLDDRFGITIKGNLSSFASVTLKDPRCIASFNATHIILSTRFSDCMSNKTETKDNIIVSNEVRMIGAPDGIITRANESVIPFYCSYSRSNWISITSFRPEFKSVVQAKESGFGNFSLSFQMARDISFGSYYSSYPVTAKVNDRLFFKISMKSNKTNAALLIEKCFATPTKSRNDIVKYTLVSNRCPKDDTFRFHTGENHHKKFSFLAFNFRNNVPVIYLHCEVFLCRENSQDQRCHTGCSVNRITKRRKRGIEKREVTDGISANYILDNGPIQKPINVDGNGKGISSSNVSTTTLVMGIAIGFLGLIVISFAIMKMIKIRKSALMVANSTNTKQGHDNKGLEMQGDV